MDMNVPVKRMKNKPSRNIILKFIGEKSTIDSDDLKMEKNSPYFWTIDNASAIAKTILQKQGVFEMILRTVKDECHCVVPLSVSCKHTNNLGSTQSPKNGVNLLQLEHEFGKGAGHVAGVIVNHTTKTINISDSMGKPAGITHFVNPLKRKYKNYTINNHSKNQGPQPSGGFTKRYKDTFIRELKEAGLKTDAFPNKFKEALFKIHSYDELSQHQFCYIESLVYICSQVFGTPTGTNVPRDRIIFIKKVIWALIMKFNLLKDAPDPVKRYFLKNFKYYIKVVTVDGKNIPLVKRMYHVPSNKRIEDKHIKLVPKLIHMPEVTPSTTMKDLIRMCV
jgi:hypothetical protein